jgi:hypothetical protein
MSHSTLARLSSALPLLALLACKLGKDNEQEQRSLPTPEPASTAPPSRPVEAEPPHTDRPKEPSRPASPSAPASPKPTATATTTAPPADAGAAAPAPSASSATAPAADKVNQCITKCQASLSACITKPVPLDAGIPNLESMTECKKAFEDCRTACSP